MILWLSSFPRSGNTFLRIVLNRLYGARTSVVYDHDGVAQRLGQDLVGYEDRPAAYDVMRASGALHIIKTHRQRGQLVRDEDMAICLVRDGRDALVSWARQGSEADPDQFEPELRRMIDRHTGGTGSWGNNVLSWLQPPAPNRATLRFEQLIVAPRDSVETILETLVPGLRPVDEAVIPTFADLQQIDSGFFRRGRPGTHRDELPDELHELFWSKPDNRAAMALLGYTAGGR